MKALPTQDRALKKRAALIQAAITEFETVGFEVATAKSIAAEAGVATGTFYQYFENKNDILRVIASERFAQLHTQIPTRDVNSIAAIDKAQIVELFEQTLMFVYEFHAHAPALHQVLEQRRTLDPKLRRIMQEGESVLQDRVIELTQQLRIGQADIVAHNLFAMAEGLVHRQVFEHSEHDAQQVMKLGATMLASYLIANHQTV